MKMITQAHQFVVSKTPLAAPPNNGKFFPSKKQLPIASAFHNKRKMAPRGRPFEPGNKFGNRFQPGESGNPGGRPRVIRDAYAKTLEEKIKVKREDGTEVEMTRAEQIALNMAECAASGHKNNVSAARELRLVVEPEEAGDTINGPMTISMAVLRDVFRKAGQIEEKMADAYELPAE
jgi:hypothetical protein